MNDIGLIKDIIHRMNTQDNRATAAPYFYQIETFQRVTSVDGDYLWHMDENEVDPNGKDMNEHLKEYHEEFYIQRLDDCAVDILEDYDAEEALEELGFEKWYYERKGVLKEFFLTEDAAKEHLRLNHYHYSHDARTFVCHAWRSPEFKNFIEAIARMVGMEYKPMGSF